MRGFIFTLDAIMAAIFAIILLVFIINLVSINTGTYLGKLQLASIGNDFLAVLELNNTFDSYVDGSQSFVSDNLQNHMSILPPNYCANVLITTYDYSGGNFVIDDQYNITKANCVVSTTEIVKVKRVFIKYNPEKYGKVEMMLWFK